MLQALANVLSLARNSFHVTGITSGPIGSPPRRRAQITIGTVELIIVDHLAGSVIRGLIPRRVGHIIPF